MSNCHSQDKDGGYYAVKGFIYQFDITMMEILKNKDKNIFVEYNQDLNYEDYVIQVKHKETQDFSFGKLKDAIVQLFLLSLEKEKQFKLYCHFKNKKMGTKETLSKKQLELWLENDYPDEEKDNFLENFEIVFWNDYQSNFNELLGLLKKEFSLDNTTPIYFHAILHNEIQKLALKNKEERNINFDTLNQLIEDSTKTIFSEGHRKYLKKEKYMKLVYDNVFKINTAHVKPYERVFIIDCKNPYDLGYRHIYLDTISKIKGKYYNNIDKKAPFIILRGLSKENINLLKQDLIDYEIQINDGTCFNGDKFREDYLLSNEKGEIKFLYENNHDIISKLNVDRRIVYYFYLNESTFEDTSIFYSRGNYHEILYDDLEDIQKIIGGVR
ncbi:hypothetical protein [Staphylococcus xylosus]|uniref:hypothetical protein n=1 Tax=Staphylococcus xylosus TaxID=1288 RepID=UPI001CDBC206|nr:hypothetical protein [Staphylococcus xylosus]MCA2503986.1 hypothetical protein [Staphylococcus xylosus]